MVRVAGDSLAGIGRLVVGRGSAVFRIAFVSGIPADCLKLHETQKIAIVNTKKDGAIDFTVFPPSEN